MLYIMKKVFIFEKWKFISLLILFLVYSNSFATELDYIGEHTKQHQKRFVINLKGYLGIPYKWSGTNFNGFDCTGLTQNIFWNNGIKIPKHSSKQAVMGVKIDSLSQLKRGDVLIFLKRDKSGVGHVAIFVNDNRIIHAVSRGVSIDSIGNNNWNSYWKSRLVSIRRVS